jgi:phosphopantetheine--protein transferase-like protein
MKRNLDIKNMSSLAQRMMWARSEADITVAALIDDNTASDDELLAQLSNDEVSKAQSLNDASERRHLIFRRCFQRMFVAEILQWQSQLSDIKIEHRRDLPPQLLDAPGLHVSFSSSGSAMLACASWQRCVGIDVEGPRRIANPEALATRFFTPGETQVIRGLSEKQRDTAFLHMWTAKEAGLKAIGKGIVSGLNQFVVAPGNCGYSIEFKGESDHIAAWTLDYFDFLPEHIVAVVHRPAV